MTQKKSSSIVTINLGKGGRWLLLLPVLLAILGGWFAVRWYVGNTIAEYAPGVDEGGVDMAQMAVRWAPGDPMTHWRLGILEEKTFSPENLAAAISEYQQAVKLSPNDFRYWTALGHALESSGDTDGSEKALRRAVELAPAYSHPRWYYGNLLLREGKYDAAFEQLGHAAESDDQMRPQVFDLAMRILNGDVNEIIRVIGVSPAAHLQFAIFLVTTERVDDGMRVWNSIGPADRRAQGELSKQLAQALLEKKQFRALLALVREIEPDTDLPALDQFWNGGFESDLKISGVNTFNWTIEPRASAQATVDTNAHGGQKSLRILFRAPRSLDKIPISQTVVVEPAARYRFECYMKTENLISASTPVLVVNDAVDGSRLGVSGPMPNGTSDWLRVTFDFNMPPQHDGIKVGFERAPCSTEGQICPIFGTVWYDDFNLQRIDGPGSPRRDAGSAKR